ncbi:MAG: nuclear transport factor 2 family protein [Acidobacteria bacterium]|nr:nuclear transport factor 2 family protein [Acidobacteriota bacterium]
MILQAIEKYGAALCALDGAALADCFSSDGEWTEPVAPTVTGPEAVRGLFEGMAQGFASLTLTPTKIYATGPQDAAFTWVGQAVMKDGRTVN